MPTSGGQAAAALHPCRSLSKRRPRSCRSQDKSSGGAQTCSQAVERQSTYAPARTGFGPLVWLLSRFPRVKLVPSFEVLKLAFIQRPRRGRARPRRIDRVVAVRKRCCGSGIRIVAPLSIRLSRNSASLPQLNLSPFIPPSDSHSSTIFWNSMGPPPYSPPTNPGPLSS